MRVFVTGASGFVGSAVVKELLAGKHTVLALARSDSSAKVIQALGSGVEILRGSLADLDILAQGASSCDGVINCAFTHDFADFLGAAQAELRAIQALGSALKERGPLVVTSGASIAVPAQSSNELITEEMPGNPSSTVVLRLPSENAALAFPNASVIRLPLVHDKNDPGFLSILIRIAREKGVSAYVGEGTNRSPSVHRADVARLYRLALEKDFKGRSKGAIYHGIAEEGIPVRDVAEVIGKKLGVPVASKAAGPEAMEHFGFLGMIIGVDCPTSSRWTKAELGWEPKEIGLLDDVEKNYF